MAEKIAEITVSGQEAQWEWEGDRNIWQQYPVEVQQEISKAFDAGETEVRRKVSLREKRKFFSLISDRR